MTDTPNHLDLTLSDYMAARMPTVRLARCFVERAKKFEGFAYPPIRSLVTDADFLKFRGLGHTLLAHLREQLAKDGHELSLVMQKTERVFGPLSTHARTIVTLVLGLPVEDETRAKVKERIERGKMLCIRGCGVKTLAELARWSGATIPPAPGREREAHVRAGL